MPVLLTAATSFVLLVNSAGRDARSRRPKGEQLWRYLTRRHKRRSPRRSRGAVLYLLFNEPSLNTLKTVLNLTGGTPTPNIMRCSP